MEVTLAGIAGEWQEPAPAKFAYPIVLLPDLFCTPLHLRLLSGYLASIGWEVCALDLWRSPTAAHSGASLIDHLARVSEVVAAIGGDVIVVGHGLGGLLALKLAEQAPIRAAVALAPMVRGLRVQVMSRRRGFASWWRRDDSMPPPASRALYEFVADADPFQREALIKGLIPGSREAIAEVVSGHPELLKTATPRLIVAGDADIFAPLAAVRALADSLQAQALILEGRGHWLVGGRALERVVHAAQRFLVHALGEDLLLLSPEELKNRGDN